MEWVEVTKVTIKIGATLAMAGVYTVIGAGAIRLFCDLWGIK